MYYLMIKEIEQTGMKYLCKRKKFKDDRDHIKYKGSGKYWRRILKAHPEYTITTRVLGLFDKEQLKIYGKFYSVLLNVVESDDWANLITEVGDGGATTKDTHPYIDKSTGVIVYRASCPNGHEPYKSESSIGLITYYNKELDKVIRIKPGLTAPEGFMPGNRPGRGYGPKLGKTKVYNNGVNKIYVAEGESPPAGFSPGLHYTGTTKDKRGCYNPTTLKKKYIDADSELPEGFIWGIAPTTGTPLSTPYGTFDSVAKCIEFTRLSRYAIYNKIKSDNEWFYIEEN